MAYTLEMTAAPDETAFNAILDAVVDYNTRMAGPSGHRPLAILIKNGSGAVTGGLWGGSGYGWLFIKLLFVPEALRAGGLGARLMAMAEQEAVQRGCRGIWLDTYAFQARGFYEKLGFRCFGELADYPVGFSRYFMCKTLEAPRADGADQS